MRNLGAIVLAVVLVLLTALPGSAAGKYKPCTLLTAAELEAVVRGKVSQTHDSDIVVQSGPYKGETISTCTWVLGTTFVYLTVVRAPRTPQELAASRAEAQRGDDKLRKLGWTIQPANIPGATCATYRPPASASGARPGAGCAMEARGLAFSLSVVGGGVTPQQVKTLGDKIAARLP